MQYFYKIWIGFIVSQVAVDATVDVFWPMHIGEGEQNAIVATFSNRDATIIDTPIEGALEYATPPDACTPIVHPFSIPKGPWRNLVLINGTNKCDFMTKVKNALAVGFEAAILFDPFPGPFNYSEMVFPLERSEINMTVALVSCEDGIELQKYLYPESREKHLVVEIRPTSTDKLLGYILISTICICLVALVFMILCAVFQKIRGKYRNRVDGNIQTPVSGDTESTPLMTPDGSEPNNCLRSTQNLKNELEEALGSVKNVSKEDTQAVIV